MFFLVSEFAHRDRYSWKLARGTGTWGAAAHPYLFGTIPIHSDRISTREQRTAPFWHHRVFVSREPFNSGEPTTAVSRPVSAVSTKLVGALTLRAQALAVERGIDHAGYRLVMNCNAQGGQTVFHIHLHLLGGRQLRRMG